mmetsp:Transcript_8660/g.10930  ORF Transcript_8660/g.10930 Transcript_8660/m.10930 type:complete len:271 (-) Transcript_8660:498-1310(-)
MKSMRRFLGESEMISLLPPMKRILCICPVFLSDEDPCNNFHKDEEEFIKDYERFSISIAVSDPYLSYAIPIVMDNNNLPEWSNKSFYVKRKLNSCIDNGKDFIWKNLPPTGTEFLAQVGQNEYTDIGGITLGSPIKYNHDDKYDGDNNNERMRKIQVAMKGILESFNNVDSENNKSKTKSMVLPRKPGPFHLQCLMSNQLKLDDIKKMALDEPEMWEEIDIELFFNNCQNDDLENKIKSTKDTAHVSIHAACALNAFLWKHTGGWRNTFA